MTQGGLFESVMETLFQRDLKCAPDTVSVSAVICRERSPGGMELVVLGGDAAIRRDTPGTVYVRVPLHAGHSWETTLLLLRCTSGSPKAQLSAEGQSSALCVLPHWCT